MPIIEFPLEGINRIIKGNSNAIELFISVAPFISNSSKTLIKSLFESSIRNDPNHGHNLYLQGLIYQYGIAEKKDPKKAAELYLKAMEGGDGEGFNAMADMIRQNQHTPVKEEFKGIEKEEPITADEYIEALYSWGMTLNNSRSFCAMADGVIQNISTSSPPSLVAQQYREAAALYLEAIRLNNAKAMVKLASLIHQGHYKPVAEDYEAGKIEPKESKEDIYQQAMPFYRHAMKLGDPSSFTHVATLIWQGHYQATPEDFTTAGLQFVTGKYSQAAAFCRRAMESYDSAAFITLGTLIQQGHYKPTQQDFKLAGLTKKVAGNRYDQAAAFYRVAMALQDSDSLIKMGGLIERGLHQPTQEDYDAAGIKKVKGKDSVIAAAFYRKAMSLSKGKKGAHELGSLIERNLYHPIEDDYKAANTNAVKGDHYAQAALFYRCGMMNGDARSFNNLAGMIKDGDYTAQIKDYTAGGIVKAEGDRNQQAAQFLRQAIILKNGQALFNLGRMILHGIYTPVKDDFEAADVDMPQGSNQFQQAAIFLYQAYVSDPSIRKQVLNTLKIGSKNDAHSSLGLTLAYIYLVHKNNTSKASYYFNKQPNKEQNLKTLVAEVIEQLDKKTDPMQTKKLLNFIIAEGAKKVEPLAFNYIQLKLLLSDQKKEEAYEYYQKNIPNYYPLTSDEYYQLGTIALEKIKPNLPPTEQEKLRQQALTLLYKSFQDNNTSDSKKIEIRATIIEHLDIKKDDYQEGKFQDFSKKECKVSDYAQDIKVLEKFGQEQLNKRSTLSLTNIISKFFKSATYQAETKLIDLLIKNLQEGKSLTEQLKDPSIRSQLQSHPSLKKKIEELISLPQDEKTPKAGL